MKPQNERGGKCSGKQLNSKDDKLIITHKNFNHDMKFCQETNKQNKMINSYKILLGMPGNKITILKSSENKTTKSVHFEVIDKYSLHTYGLK